MHKFKIYATLVIVLLVAIVIAQNTAVVETKILFATIAMPRAALLAVTLLAGIVIGVVLTLSWRRKKKSVTPATSPD